MVRYPINEIFGPTLQGEGIHIGTKTMFIRFAGCDCRCSWCDTKYAWNTEEAEELTSKEILIRLVHKLFKTNTEYDKSQFPSVTLTGGNPLLYDLSELLPELRTVFPEIHVETQGTKMQKWINCVDFVAISPKPDSYNLQVIYEISSSLPPDKCLLKIVIFNKQDLYLAKMLHEIFPTINMCLQLGYTENSAYPEEDHLNLIDHVLTNPNFNNVRILPQLHRILWGNKKGV